MRLFCILAAFAAFVIASPTESNWFRAGADVVANPIVIPDTVRPSVTDIYVSLGKTQRHVGNVVGSDLYGHVWQGLARICPVLGGHCNKESIVIPVPYVDQDRYLPGKLVIILKDSRYPTNEKFHNLLIGLVAGALQRSSEDRKNCYWTTYGSQKRRVWFCNVGNTVWASIKDAFIRVEIKAEGSGGTFDCPAILRSVEDSVDDLMPELREVFGRDPTRLVDCGLD
ncbi:hypothetical protein B0J11DRAFT_564118 [Dendryphion nanum]|uniref:Uncharacterized protein n=1 Tax=Dendryphion nanum TaxID=256645 RepID=A0A9P9EGV3_9PLEO|nr:hypothetical protein B0J11DRAFT_564118 [Dendryphion nanum]